MLDDYFQVNARIFELKQCLAQKDTLSVKFYLCVFREEMSYECNM